MTVIDGDAYAGEALLARFKPGEKRPVVVCQHGLEGRPTDVCQPIVDPKKNKIVWSYGHLNQPGTQRGYLNTPDGMDYIPLGVHEKPLWQLVHHP